MFLGILVKIILYNFISYSLGNDNIFVMKYELVVIFRNVKENNKEKVVSALLNFMLSAVELQD